MTAPILVRLPSDHGSTRTREVSDPSGRREGSQLEPQAAIELAHTTEYGPL